MVEVCAVFCYCYLVARCLETIDVCIWRMFGFMSVVVIVGGGGLWECLLIAAVVKDSVFSLGVLKYVVCLCKGCDGCFVCIVTRGAVGARACEV